MKTKSSYTIVESDTSHTSSVLCCCEYIDNHGERSHLLACCCNCVELDNCCESLVRCQRLSSNQISQIELMLSDKLRVPWKGGAKKLSLDACIPLFVVPSVLLLAAQSMWHTIIVFTILPPGLYYIHNFLLKHIPDSKFFSVWAVTSIAVIYIVFEYTVIPVLLIKFEENVIFLFFLLSATFCFVRTRMLAKTCYLKNYSVLPSSSTESIVKLSDDGEEATAVNFTSVDSICPVCCKRIPPRTYHCNQCHACIYKRDLHCMWLDCCIGEKNHKMYMLGLVLMTLAMLVCAYLIFTSFCSTSDIFIIPLPVGCSEAYIDIVYTILFIIALYSMMISVFLLTLVLHEAYMISMGMTGHEWRTSSQKIYWCLRPKSIYSKGCSNNWKTYLNSMS